jgi:hypothetical protein
VIQHTCGATVPATVDAFVRHVAACPSTRPEMRAWSQEIVSRVDEIAAMDETPAVSRDMSTSQMAAMRDAGASLRGIAAAAGVAPETVRRRLARHAGGTA